MREAGSSFWEFVVDGCHSGSRVSGRVGEAAVVSGFGAAAVVAAVVVDGSCRCGGRQRGRESAEER